MLRGAASEVIAWAPYNQETPYVVTNDSVLTGTGGNPNLDPYKSDNFNLSAEWYFAPESVVAASVFYKDIKNYIMQGVGTEHLFNSLVIHQSRPCSHGLDWLQLHAMASATTASRVRKTAAAPRPRDSR